ncbi:carbohydrate ABC transporter permease [Mesorhizobium australicum]|uniref:Carbohydrate ABC transporter membrane protein 2, CUT1 family n=1 Tax=Mesorhizobium australicum TaxID=536018 RepID=A0A1X7MV41_9HYPH|nr:carbohydrate ABC transporter permease [Mesorhizobium australicum]SMH28189.1 carbohydrate ABC transporter membrane protein 2, CUT1 family [Mesorhizobium australicum]
MSAIAHHAATRRRSRFGSRLRISAGVVVCFIFLFPLIWMVLTSFKEQRDIFTMPPTLFFTPTLESYTTYLQRPDIWRRLVNTVIVAVGSGLVSIVAGAMAGYALARIRLRGAGMIGLLIVLSRGVPPIALAVPMFLVARKLGLTDQHITLILAYCTFLIPYVMWLMRGFFLSLPKELEESAMIDGCSRFGAFFKIIVPISLPGLLSTLIFSMILAWEELLFALVLTNRNASTIPVAIQGIAGDTINGANWAALTAVGTITVLPVVVFAMLVQKWLVQGMADGATKG